MGNFNKNKQKHIIQEIYQCAYFDNLNMRSFSNLFFTSDECKMILQYSNVDYFNARSEYSKFIKKNNIGKENKYYTLNEIIYVAFIYVKFFQRTNESPNKIIRYLPFNKIIDSYDYYHTISEERIIFLSKLEYNKSLNSIRKMRSKTNELIHLNNDEEIIKTAKELYLKLFYYPEIENSEIQYRNELGWYVLGDNFFLSSGLISSINDIKVLLNNKALERIRYNTSNNVLYVFNTSNNELKDNDIKEIFYQRGSVPYDKLLIYSNGVISFINNDGFYKFYINITKLDINKIDSEITQFN